VVIEGFAGGLMRKCAGKLEERERENLSIIRDQARKMTRFISDLLLFSRAGNKDIKRSDIEMGVLVQDVVGELQRGIQGRNVQFVVGDLPPAVGDPLMVRQALVNLMSNALKYSATRDAAVIEVGSVVYDGASAYFVRDNGVGFDADRKDRLFTLFNRLHSPREFEGTGMGLVIAKRIVNKHGGNIWAEGRVDEGATFYFTLSEGVAARAVER
jgi:two-component system sensor kinase